jgi:hypothetical protein
MRDGATRKPRIEMAEPVIYMSPRDQFPAKDFRKLEFEYMGIAA